MALTTASWTAVVNRKWKKSPEFGALDVAVRDYLAHPGDLQRVPPLAAKWQAWIQKLADAGKNYKESDRYLANGSLDALEEICRPHWVNIYLSGHGFMWKACGVKPNNIALKFDMWTYVPDQKLFDGNCLKDLISFGDISERSQKAFLDEGTSYHPEIHKAGSQVCEYLLVSDERTRMDYTSAGKYGGHERTSDIEFGPNFGTLIKLTEGTYVYATKDRVLTRLSDIQDRIFNQLMVIDAKKFHPNTKFALHWAACRSNLNSATNEALIQTTNNGSVRVSELAGAQLPSERIDEVGGVSVVKWEEGIKATFHNQIQDCIIFAESINKIVTIVLPYEGARGDELFKSPAQFFSKVRDQMNPGIEGFSFYKTAQRKGLWLLGPADVKSRLLDRSDLRVRIEGNGSFNAQWVGVEPRAPVKKAAK